MLVFGEMNVFLELRWIGLFGTPWPYLHEENYDYRKNYVQNLTEFSQANNVLDAPVSNTDGFFREIHVFLQISWIKLFAGNRVYIQLENCDLQEAYIAKTNSFPT
jgi:hypothetical protein